MEKHGSRQEFRKLKVRTSNSIIYSPDVQFLFLFYNFILFYLVSTMFKPIC